MKRLHWTALAAIALLLVLCLTACGQKTPAAPKEVDLAGVLASFALPEGSMTTLRQEDLLDMYGIQPEDAAQFAAVISASGVKADEIVLIQSPDAAAAERVKAALEARYQAKLNETQNYLPEEYAVVKACKVTQTGLFTALIVSPEAEQYLPLFEQALK